MQITVIGTGYLGAVHAAGMAALGHDVLGVDADEAKIDALCAGDAPFYEPGLQELLRDGIRAGKLRFTTSIAEAAAFGDVHFVCVGTPQRPGSDAADLSYVESAVSDLIAGIDRSALIVGKSTVPVGTARHLAEIAADASEHVMLAWNPEFLREGFAVEDTLSPDRLVFGVDDAFSESVLRSVYAPIIDAGVPCHVTDLETSELVKVAANSFLAMKISFINSMAEVCEAVGADVVTLADAIGQDERIGRRFLNAGVGFGGGCLGKDIRAFHARGVELGVGDAVSFLQNVDRTNNRRRDRVLELASEILDGDVRGRRISILGAAFKPNSDDVRDSPALHIARALHESGAKVRVHDPAAIDNARRMLPDVGFSSRIDDAFADSELVIHLTEWEQYRDLDPRLLAGRVDQPVLIDGRNALDGAKWSAAGWTYHSLGRTVSPASLTTSQPDTAFSQAEEEAVA